MSKPPRPEGETAAEASRPEQEPPAFFDEAHERARREEMEWRAQNPGFDYGEPPAAEIEVIEELWGAYSVSQIDAIRPADVDSESIADGALDPPSFEAEVAMFLDTETLGRLALDLFRECDEGGLLSALRVRPDGAFEGRALDHATVEAELGVGPSFRAGKPSPGSTERRAAYVAAMAMLLARPGVDLEPWRRGLVDHWPEAPFGSLPPSIAFEMGVLLERYRAHATRVEARAASREKPEAKLSDETEKAQKKAAEWIEKARTSALEQWAGKPAASAQQIARAIRRAFERDGVKDARGNCPSIDSIARKIGHLRPPRAKK